VAGCETLQTNIALHIKERNIPLNLETLGITVLFLLECKKWALHLKDIALNNINLLKFNEMSYLIKLTSTDAYTSGVFKYAKN
jgi:hypothetical protein